MSITTLVLQDKPQGCILSNFYKPLRALSLPRMLAEFFLTCIFHYSWEIFHIYDLHIPSKCIESKNIYLSPPPKSKLSPKFLSSPPGRVKLLISPSQCFSKICFPNSRKGCRNQWFALLKFNQEIWRWLGTLGYLYFAWPIIFQMWWLCSFLNNLSII